jgi:hypothetical protein
MNQRINQLKQAAGIDFNPDQEGLNLFAELIVKECMTICEDVAERNDPAIACYYEIKKTFRS